VTKEIVEAARKSLVIGPLSHHRLRHLSLKRVRHLSLKMTLPVLPVANWARRAIHSGYWCVARGSGQPPIVTYPLSYPNLTGAFYGYDAPDHAPDVIAPERGCVRCSNRSDQPGMRSLVTGILWAATGLIAHRAQIYVLRKRDVPALYARHIGGEWANLLEELYRRCRGEWHCAIPLELAQRVHLRTTRPRAGIRESCAGTVQKELARHIAGRRRQRQVLRPALPAAQAVPRR